MCIIYTRPYDLSTHNNDNNNIRECVLCAYNYDARRPFRSSDCVRRRVNNWKCQLTFHAVV